MPASKCYYIQFCFHLLTLVLFQANMTFIYGLLKQFIKIVLVTRDDQFQSSTLKNLKSSNTILFYDLVYSVLVIT